MYNRNADAAFAERAARKSEDELRNEKRKKRAARVTGMHTVSPIEDDKTVAAWLSIAKEHDAHMQRGGASWYLLLLLGFNTGLRIGDLCRLKVGDVRGRERVLLQAQKTGKEADVKLQAAAQKALYTRLRDRDENEYVLESRQKSRQTGEAKPITRQRAYGIVKQIAQISGFTGRVGCHTLRKTFALDYYESSGDLADVQKILNHSSQAATLHYLGLDKKHQDEVIDRKKVRV